MVIVVIFSPHFCSAFPGLVLFGCCTSYTSLLVLIFPFILHFFDFWLCALGDFFSFILQLFPLCRVHLTGPLCCASPLPGIPFSCNRCNVFFTSLKILTYFLKFSLKSLSPTLLLFLLGLFSFLTSLLKSFLRWLVIVDTCL